MCLIAFRLRCEQKHERVNCQAMSQRHHKKGITRTLRTTPRQAKRTREDFWREQAAQLEEAIKTRAD
ncbi:hypothetical protein [Rhodoferax antarcticus]|uniref:hypothetical protein n=1 Tax=Rhodoferax antarcticus TaxID=81479 RepID=UPI001A7E0F14|nr:hypothetical protein [Rhodoferax antarcticus]